MLKHNGPEPFGRFGAGATVECRGGVILHVVLGLASPFVTGDF